jgi:hypothetical protein
MTTPAPEASLRARIFESVDNAVANGFKASSWSAAALTDDLMTFDAVAERHERPEVLRAVEAWLREKGGGQ